MLGEIEAGIDQIYTVVQNNSAVSEDTYALYYIKYRVG